MDKEIQGIYFEWDDEKNAANLKKHGISFGTAALVFLDPDYIELYDLAHSDDEERYIAIGRVEQILFVVHTMRDEEHIRLISARMANAQERKYYEECQHVYP